MRSLQLGTLAMVALSATSAAAQSGSGTTTRYWDCCKPSCAWNNAGGIDSPVKVCDKSDQPLTGGDVAQSGCTGGTAYMCSDQSPWAVNDDLAYGFAAVSSASPNCCACYQLTFTSGAIAGKKMVVQATNTGSDVGSTQFDLAMPGGGFGQFDGCTKEWAATSDVWGAQYGGPTTNTCSKFPSALKPGCSFRWDWFQGTENPTVDYEVVTCPAEIVAKSGCSRSGERPGSSGVTSRASAVSILASSPTTLSTLSTRISSIDSSASIADAGRIGSHGAVATHDTANSHSTKPYAIGTATPISPAANAPFRPHAPHRQSPAPSVPKKEEEQDDDDTCEP